MLVAWNRPETALSIFTRRCPPSSADSRRRQAPVVTYAPANRNIRLRSAIPVVTARPQNDYFPRERLRSLPARWHSESPRWRPSLAVAGATTEGSLPSRGRGSRGSCRNPISRHHLLPSEARRLKKRFREWRKARDSVVGRHLEFGTAVKDKLMMVVEIEAGLRTRGFRPPESAGSIRRGRKRTTWSACFRSRRLPRTQSPALTRPRRRREPPDRPAISTSRSCPRTQSVPPELSGQPWRCRR